MIFCRCTWQKDKQINKHTDKQTEEQTEKPVDKKIDWQIYKQTEKIKKLELTEIQGIDIIYSAGDLIESPDPVFHHFDFSLFITEWGAWRWIFVTQQHYLFIADISSWMNILQLYN